MKCKKLTALFLIVLLAISLFACGGDNQGGDNSGTESKTEETKNIDGKYWLYRMGADGETADYETIKMIGMDSSYLEINGAKFVLALTGEEAGEGTHNAELKQLIAPDGEAIVYTLDGEKIAFTIDGSTLEFVKDGSSLLTPSTNSSEVIDESSEGTGDGSEDVVIDSDVFGNYVLVGEGYSEGNYYEPYTPAYVVLKEDGTGSFISGGSEMELDWTLDGENFDGVVYGFGEMTMVGTLSDGVLEVEYGDGYYMQLEYTTEEIGSTGDNSETDDNSEAVDDDNNLALYEGDWHGVVLFDEGQGDYANLTDSTAEIIARFNIDEFGDITPFIALALSSGKENNLENITTEYYSDSELGTSFLGVEGQFLGIDLDLGSFIEYENGTLIGYMGVDDGAGNSVCFYLCMRHLDDEWDEENDFPCMPDDMYNYYYGMTLEEIAVLFGYEESDLPVV